MEVPNFKKEPIKFLQFIANLLSTSFFIALIINHYSFLNAVFICIVFYIIVGPVFILLYKKFGDIKISKLSMDKLFGILLSLMFFAVILYATYKIFFTQ